ncbi:MAG TPA: hypothetical protein VF331_02315 [Polyangiales bacterium]
MPSTSLASAESKRTLGLQGLQPMGGSSWAAVVAAALVVSLWSSVGLVDTTRSPSTPVRAALRECLTTLYGQSGDEALYYFTASQLLGKPYAHTLPDRGTVPEAFQRAPLASDGHWHVPYREVPLEYPPLVLPLIVLPRLLVDRPEAYYALLRAFMALLLGAATAIALRALPAHRTS